MLKKLFCLPLLSVISPNLFAEGLSMQAGAASPISQSLLMTFLMAAIFYLMIWRPQSKKTKEQKNLMNNLTVADEVVTSSGILGKIIRLSEQFVVLEISPGAEVKFQKQAIAQVLPKGSLKEMNKAH